ncbi:MAG: UDP-N-acetylglucosamine 2-epimerase (non-hydrolyzing) [Catenulispora sp.]|nr:UDP-N-acetylglucosamine 2-epimerase (non-hydrolyzing) [Catenulispora sp.]
MRTLRLTVPFGTRPEIVKLAPVVRALREQGWPTRLVFTGQHYDPALGADFFGSLDMEPDARWNLPPEPAAALGALLERAVEEVTAFAADAILLLGDTMTVPVFCLAARRACVPVVHLEAGLRSFNDTSIEEVNRRIAAATASLHLAPTALAAEFLYAEGVDAARVRVVGNTVLDVVRGSGVARVAPDARRGVLVTAHRASTVDSPTRLATLVALLVRIAGLTDRDAAFGPVLFPVHPRTRDRLDAAGLVGTLTEAGIALTAPLPYAEMLAALAGARVVVTDSGGLQEEAAWFGVPVVVLRRSTPRWEGVAAGSSELVGLDGDAAVAAVARFADADELKRVDELECPYGDGFTALRVVSALGEADTAGLLRFGEPDFVGRPVPGRVSAQVPAQDSALVLAPDPVPNSTPVPVPVRVPDSAPDSAPAPASASAPLPLSASHGPATAPAGTGGPACQ